MLQYFHITDIFVHVHVYALVKDIIGIFTKSERIFHTHFNMELEQICIKITFIPEINLDMHQSYKL